jgi:hypothetical protein
VAPKKSHAHITHWLCNDLLAYITHFYRKVMVEDARSHNFNIFITVFDLLCFILWKILSKNSDFLGSNDKTVIIWDLTNTFTLDSHITGMRSLLFTLASNQIDIPLEFICPITHEIMKAPVMADGK